MFDVTCCTQSVIFVFGNAWKAKNAFYGVTKGTWFASGILLQYIIVRAAG